MIYYYITLSSRKIQIPFVPSLEPFVEDAFIILNNIFGENMTDDERYLAVYQIIIDAVKYNKPEYWENAAEMLLELDGGKYSMWVSHFLKIAEKIRHPQKHKKEVVIIPFYSSEKTSVKKLNRLINGKELQDAADL